MLSSRPKAEVNNIDRSTRNKLILKWIVLGLFILFVFTLQSTPSFLEILGIKPLLLLPLAVSISMFEGEWVGGLVAMACGLLWDMAGEAPFGSYGFLCLVVGVATGLLLKLLLRNEWFNCLFLVFTASVIIICMEFLFAYGIRDYDNIGQIFLTKHLPMIFYTSAISPALYFVVKSIEKIKHE